MNKDENKTESMFSNILNKIETNYKTYIAFVLAFVVVAVITPFLSEWHLFALSVVFSVGFLIFIIKIDFRLNKYNDAYNKRAESFRSRVDDIEDHLQERINKEVLADRKKRYLQMRAQLMDKKLIDSPIQDDPNFDVTHLIDQIPLDT